MAIRHICGSVIAKSDSKTWIALLDLFLGFISRLLGRPVEFKSVAAWKFPVTESDELDLLEHLNLMLRDNSSDTTSHTSVRVWGRRLLPTGNVIEEHPSTLVIPGGTISRVRAASEGTELRWRTDGGGIDYSLSPAANRLWEIILENRGDYSSVIVWSKNSKSRLILGFYTHLDGKVEAHPNRLEVAIMDA